MRFCDTTGSQKNFAKDPCVIRLGETYFLYYSLWIPEDGREKLDIGIARSCDMEHWEIVGRVPVGDGCEKNGIGAPGAIVLDGTVHLFYQTYGNDAADAICHATSRDGMQFIKDATNPIFSPSADWCAGRAIDADVIAFRGRLYLYFATRDRAMKIQKLGVASADLHSDFSRPAWRQEVRQSILAPELPFEGECIEAPAAVVWRNEVYLFYGGAYNCSPQQIGAAKSVDAVHFDKLFADPFLPAGAPGSWNAHESGHPFVFADGDGRLWLFYQGTADHGESWYLTRREIVIRDGAPCFPD